MYALNDLYTCTYVSRPGMFVSIQCMYVHVGVLRDANSYNAAIWAHEAGENSFKATELLRLMKFEGLSVSFDGVLSALSKKGEWAQILDILQWMSQDGVEKSYVTYRLVIDTLDW
jgi:hypothetical protein